MQHTMLLSNVQNAVIMSTSQTPSLRVVNKYKKDITARVPPRKSSALLVKLEVVATQRVKTVQLGCIKIYQAIQYVLLVHLVLATKLPVQLDAMLSLLVPTLGMAKSENVHRVITAKEKQKTKQLVSLASTQQLKDLLHASTVQQVNMQHSRPLLLVNRAIETFIKKIRVTTHAVDVQQGS